MKQHKYISRSLAAAMVLALLLAALTGCSDSPEPVKEPASGTILSGYAPKDGSQITISIEDTGSCVVMMKDDSDRTLLSFYIRSGDTVTVDVPAEKMYVSVAAGMTWYGEELLFGKNTVYSEDKELADFAQHSWECEFDPMDTGDFEYLDPDAVEEIVPETEEVTEYIDDLADSPEPVSEPASGTILSGYAPEDGSQITISIEDTGSCVVMMKDTAYRTLLSFYVRSGDTVTVDVPAEKMYVHFAAGTTWYGEELLFGEDTVYSEDKELTDFTQYSWTYEFDPMDTGDFEYVDTDEEEEFFFETEEETGGYIGDLEGSWESVYLEDGSFMLNVTAVAFPETIYNCTQMTINMEVEMNAGTSCKDWQVWGRTGNSFVKLDTIYLAAGNGYTSQTLYFASPVTFDAIAVTPTVPGGYSWSMGISVTDVWGETY